MPNFNNRIRELREKRSISGPQLAEFLGISVQYLYELEKGVKRLNEPMIRKLTKYFLVSSDYILGYDDSCNEDTPSPKSKRLISVIARADELPEENIEDIADTLDALIKVHKNRIMKKKNTPDTK